MRALRFGTESVNHQVVIQLPPEFDHQRLEVIVFPAGENAVAPNSVSCVQCEYCGEQYFHAGVLKQIETEFQAIYQQGKKATTEVLVPVELYSKLKKIAS